MSEPIDSRAHRIRTLKHIIRHLHEGRAPEQVKERLAELVRETDATEIAEMEQQLITEGMPVEEIQSMCDLHSQVLREITVPRDARPFPPGHPGDTFIVENRALGIAAGKMGEALAGAAKLDPGADPGEALLEARAALGDLMDVEKHYRRKEHLLFSVLERRGVTGPSKVMWGKDDEVREKLKALDEALRAEGLTAGDLAREAEEHAEPALAALQEMIYKEEKVLLPMARDMLTDDEWGEIWTQSPEYGWCIVAPREGWKPPEAMEPASTAKLPEGAAVSLPSGSLTFEQLAGVFSTLPVDLTFVDAGDRVRFFTEGPERVFARSRAVVGRKVQHCHPPKSVHVVERILSDFRAGRRDVAEFWIELRGKFLHIRYFAVRDGDGEYLGTLEVSQDVTRIRALEGERRLLQYDE